MARYRSNGRGSPRPRHGAGDGYRWSTSRLSRPLERVPQYLDSSSLSGSDPASSIASHVNVNERSVPAFRRIHACPAYQPRVFALHTIDCGEDHLAVPDIELPVVVEVVHPAIAVVIDEDVGRVAVHMATQRRAPAWISARHVVLRRTKSTHDL